MSGTISTANNNVSNFGGYPVTQLNLKNVKTNLIRVLWAWRSIAVTRSQFLRRLLRDHVPTAAVWKTVAGHTSLSTALVVMPYGVNCSGVRSSHSLTCLPHQIELLKVSRTLHVDQLCRDSSGACLCVNPAPDRQKAHNFRQRVP